MATFFTSEWSSRMLSILRIVAALLFMQHGGQKLFGFPPTDHGPVPLMSMMGLAGIIEFFGGLLILLGLFTRPAALIASGQMAVAYFMAHAPQAFWPVINQGELAVLYCFVFLFFAVAGPGVWSLDYQLRGRTRDADIAARTDRGAARTAS